MDVTPKMKLLLAEDHVATGGLYKQMLESKGFEVDLVVDGIQAFNLAHNGGYRLILLDVMMPKMNGIAVLKQLKQEPPLVPNGPIVMLTNLTDEALVHEAVSLGALSYMDKSNLEPQQLADKVAGVLGLPKVEK